MTKKTAVQEQKTHKETSFLQQHCREVWWSCSKLPTGRQVSATSKRDMVATVEGESDGYSITKKIFASRHPAIKALNEVFRKIDQLRDDYTIVKSAAASTDTERFQILPGRRIIRVVDIEEFEQKFLELRQELRQATEVVVHCLDHEKAFDGKVFPSIKQLDQAKIGKSYDPKDYPDAETLRQSIKVSVPQYGVMQPDTLLPPKVLARECERINQELGDTVALAANRVGLELVAAMETLARNLSFKTNLDPLPGDKWRDDLIKVHPVEVVNVLETRHDRSIPAGSVKLELSWRESKPDGSVVTVKAFSPILTKDQYQKELRPRETDSRRVLQTRTVEKLYQNLECLGRVKAMLGQDGNEIEKSIKTVKELLTSCSRDHDPDRATQELRQNGPMATTLQRALQEAVQAVAETSEEVIKSRRKISI